MPTRRRRLRAAVPAVAPEPTRGELTQALAISDTRRIGGLSTPEVRYNPDQLASRKGGLRVYESMTWDEQIAACLDLTTAAVIGPGWALEPADDQDEQAQSLAGQLEADLRALPGPLEDVLAQLLTARAYGFAVAELMWAPDGRRLRLTGIRPLAPHHLDFVEDPFGVVTGVRQLWANGVTYPPGKFVHFVTRPQFGVPYGTSDLRQAYRAWWHKTNWIQWLAIYGEKLADAPIVSNPPSGTPLDRIQTAEAVLENLQARTVLTVPGDWKVTTLSDGRDPRRTFLEAIEHYDRQIAKALLVPDKMGLVGGEVKGGSYSLSETQLGVFFFTLTLLQRRLETCVQEQVVARMAALAGAAEEQTPKFRLLPMTSENREALAQLVIAAIEKGVLQTVPRDTNRLRELLKLSPLTEEELAEQEREKEEAAERMESLAEPGAEAEPEAEAEDEEEAEGEGETEEEGDDDDEEERAAMASGFWRRPTRAEERMDLAATRDRLDRATSALAESLATAAEAIIADVRARARKLLPDPDPDAVQALAATGRTTAATRKAIQTQLAEAYDAARAAAEREVAQASGARVRAKRPGLVGNAATKFFRAKAFWITGVLEEEILNKAKAVLFNAAKGDKLPRHIETELDESLNAWLPVRDAAGRLVNVPARIETIARTNLQEATSEGRYALFTDPDLEGFVEGLQYSAIMDDRTREEHAAWDGVVKPADWWLGPPDRRPPNGFNCRCMLVPVLSGDGTEATPDEELPSAEVTDPGFR